MSTTDATGRTFSVIPVQRPREQIEGQLRRAILDGAIKQGERLPSENALAQSFNVSRATIREALRSLIEGGLLVKGSGSTSGLYVELVDHNALSRLVSDRLGSILDLGSVSAAEVATFRDLLEVPSARMAASRRTVENLQTIHDIIDQERAATFDDPAGSDYNAAFHTEVANASGNRVLASFVAALHRIAHPLAFIHTDEELGRTAVQHHIRLYQAIEKQDAAEAEAVMQSHLDYLREHAKANGTVMAAPDTSS